MTKAQKAERNEAIAKLREWIKPGDTVYTILDHVSSSGMSRAIRVVLLSCENNKPTDLHPNRVVGRALGLRHWKRNRREQDALVIGGCGMDMGFHLVNSLSYTIYPEYVCTGENCPSPEHSNNMRRETCGCGHDAYNHEVLEREGWLVKYGKCEQVACTCQSFNKIENVDHRGPGVKHSDGYALRHRWL